MSQGQNQQCDLAMNAPIPKPVDADTLRRVVWRLANQMPVRYYLDARYGGAVLDRCDGSYSHVALELYFPDTREPARLDGELRELGFVPCGIERASPPSTIYQATVRRWEAPRKTNEQGEFL